MRMSFALKYPVSCSERKKAPFLILLIPVGGVYTVDYKQALEIAYAIAPKVVIPMHYAADKLAFELGELAPFLENAKNCAIHRMRQSEAVITRESLGSNRIIG